MKDLTDIAIQEHEDLVDNPDDPTDAELIEVDSETVDSILNFWKEVEYYKNNIGEETEFKTVIDEKLIEGVEKRISQLEEAEDRLDKWKAVEFGLDD